MRGGIDQLLSSSLDRSRTIPGEAIWVVEVKINWHGRPTWEFLLFVDEAIARDCLNRFGTAITVQSGEYGFDWAKVYRWNDDPPSDLPDT